MLTCVIANCPVVGMRTACVLTIQFTMQSGGYSPHRFHLQGSCMWQSSSWVCHSHRCDWNVSSQVLFDHVQIASFKTNSVVKLACCSILVSSQWMGWSFAQARSAMAILWCTHPYALPTSQQLLFIVIPPPSLLIKPLWGNTSCSASKTRLSCHFPLCSHILLLSQVMISKNSICKCD